MNFRITRPFLRVIGMLIIILVIGCVIFWALTRPGGTVTKEASTPVVVKTPDSEKAIVSRLKSLESRVGALEHNEYLLNTTEKEQAALASYLDGELNISFEYPAYWGTVKKSNLGGDMVGAKSIGFSVLGDVLVADFPNDTERARGSFYGDWAREIKDQSFISNFCSDLSYGICVQLKNNNGISIIKNTGCFAEGCVEDGNDSEWDEYFMFNPLSKWTGIAISTGNVSVRDRILGFDKQFEKFVYSFDYIEEFSSDRFSVKYPSSVLKKEGLGYVIFSNDEGKIIIGTVSAILKDSDNILAQLNGLDKTAFNRFLKNYEYAGKASLDKVDHVFASNSSKNSNTTFQNVLSWISYNIKIKK